MLFAQKIFSALTFYQLPNEPQFRRGVPNEEDPTVNYLILMQIITPLFVCTHQSLYKTPSFYIYFVASLLLQRIQDVVRLTLIPPLPATSPGGEVCELPFPSDATANNHTASEGEKDDCSENHLANQHGLVRPALMAKS